MAKNLKPVELDLLSKNTIKILKGLWREHCDKTEWEMVEYVHEHCKEWEKPLGASSEIISYKTLLSKGFGYEEKKAKKGATHLKDQQELISILYDLNLE